jgi:hypothetical protein
MTANADACVLISASCTTSWFDWIHGELWLCPDGIVRRSLGLWATIRHFNRQTVDPDRRPTRSFTPDEIERILRDGRRNRSIPFDSIAHVTLKVGIIDHSLHIQLLDGRRDKLLWLQLDGGFDVLQDALRERLGDRFTLWDQPTG